MKIAKQGYVTFNADGAFAPAASAPEQGQASAPEAGVAYRLSRIAEEAAAEGALAPNAVDAADSSGYNVVPSGDASAYSPVDAKEDEDARPRVLLMSRGRMARQYVQAATDAGFSVWLPFTTDKRFEPYLRQAAGTVCLGEKYSDALFCNAHAVLDAAKECGAGTVLLCDESQPLGEVDGFLSRAISRGVNVFRPLKNDTPALGWVLCTTEKAAPAVDKWRACPHCGLKFAEESLAASHYVCPTCGGYFRMTSDERIADLLDSGSFEEWDAHMPEPDPLEFPGYTEKLAALREKTGLDEGIRTGAGRIAGIRTAFAVMESTFLMGSMGTAVGEKMARLVRRAADEGLPVVAFTASGGARMQEGLASLMQMAKVSCALSRLAECGLPYISVITDPTTGGVTASFAMQGDIILAEPHALIGFAGQRVIRDTIKQELPKGFQTAEFALSHGLIDAVVSRSDLRATLAQLLALHYATRVQGEPVAGEERMIVTYDSVKSNLEHGTDTYNKVTYGLLPVDEGLLREDEEDDSLPLSLAETVFGWFGGKTRQLEREADRRRAAADAHADGISDEKATACAPTAGAPAAEPAADADAQAAVGVQTSSAWESVQLARNVHRPTSRYYIDRIVDGFIELHGDRGFGDDGAIVAGVGWIGNQAVTVIAEEKGCDLKDRIKRNFGCPQPEGYRKSLRLMREAEKFGRPIVCFVDTQGAFCGMEAEERGQGNAIADNLLAMAGIKVPIVSVLLGEGGSGGALALAVANRVAMQEHAVYSVLSPEGFASILWKDRTRAPEAAAVMKMSAAEAYGMGIVDDVLSEGPAPAHENPDAAVDVVRDYVRRELAELSSVPADDLVEQRRARFEAF